MKTFNLQEALAGKPVVTRTGILVTELHFFKTVTNEWPLTAVVDGERYTYRADGTNNFKANVPNRYDLFMATEKKEGWINIYRYNSNAKAVVGDIHATEDFALTARRTDAASRACVATVRVTWEE